MKTSNKILWGSLIGIFGICVIFLVALRVLLNGHFEPSDKPTIEGPIGSRKITMTDFSGIDLQGNWKAEVVQGDKEQIIIKGPEDLLAGLFVNRLSDSLSLHMAKDRSNKRKLTLIVTMPKIHAVQTKGVVEMRISGFDTDRLSIDAEGVTSITGKKGHIGNLDLQGEGVTKIDLQDFPVHTADINCEGVIKIDLDMTGGELTGRLEGIGRVSYTGKTSRESIHKDGPLKVDHKSHF
ncbi:MAG: hypothetical protein GY729_21420 [Desulfobacteraceae bacterium]|nr:hypothetical protein [Desulfobacteraceae bacterium]